MSSALERGRTLDANAVEMAREWRGQRLEYIRGKAKRGSYFSKKECAEARRLTGRIDFWNA